MREVRPRFFVRIEAHGNRETVKVFLARILDGVEDREHPALAVRAPWPLHMVAFVRHGTGGRRAVGEHGVKVRVQKNVVLFGAGFVGREESATGAFSEIDEFGMKSDRVKVPLHDFRGGRNTRTVGRAAVAVDEFGEILQVAFEHFC